MGTVVTIRGVPHTVEKLDTGNIRVSHPGEQLHPMKGPDTDGLHFFEVHPCQTKWYAYWNEQLPPNDRKSTGPGRDGEKPWWSSKGWKKAKKDR